MLWRPDRSVPSAFIQPCLPTPSKVVPRGPEWVHEIKHDGYRLIVRRDGRRLFTRNGYDWTRCFSWIVEAMHRLKVQSAIVDGEAVVCDENGMANFDKFHSKSHDDAPDDR